MLEKDCLRQEESFLKSYPNCNVCVKSSVSTLVERAKALSQED